jgi:hypothetical protein
MPTKDGFSPGQPLPVFLADELEAQGIGKAWDTAAVSSLVLKASILVATATAIGIAILSVGNLSTLFADVTASFANVTASLIDKSAVKPDTDQSTPTVQSTADAQALLPTAQDAPIRDEVAVASEPAGQSPTETGQSQTESSEPVTEALFKQFQAWADEKDAQAQVAPVHPVQDAVQNSLAQVADNPRASSRPVQKRRNARAVHNARAEIRAVHNSRKKLRRERNARVQEPPAQDARAQQQGQLAQNAQTSPLPAPTLQAPSFLQSFGWRN